MSGSKCKGSYLFIWVSQEFSVIHIWKGFFYFGNLERISLLVDRETSMSASLICSHCIWDPQTVLYHVLEMLIAWVLVYQMAYFISCGESQSSATLLMLYIQIVVIVVSCIKCVVTVSYIYIYIYTHTHTYWQLKLNEVACFIGDEPVSFTQQNYHL